MNLSIKRHANKIYASNDTMNIIYESQDSVISEIVKTLYKNLYNNFAVLADVNGIANFEKMLKILPDVKEQSLEFRRATVLQTLASIPPFTKIFLDQMLQSIFGEGKYSFTVDYNNYAIYINIEADVTGLYEHIKSNIRVIVPANLSLRVVANLPPDNTTSYQYHANTISIQQTLTFNASPPQEIIAGTQYRANNITVQGGIKIGR